MALKMDLVTLIKNHINIEKYPSKTMYKKLSQQILVQIQQ